jgi:hypothetical protein
VTEDDYYRFCNREDSPVEYPRHNSGPTSAFPEFVSFDRASRSFFDLTPSFIHIHTTRMTKTRHCMASSISPVLAANLAGEKQSRRRLTMPAHLHSAQD